MFRSLYSKSLFFLFNIFYFSNTYAQGNSISVNEKSLNNVVTFILMLFLVIIILALPFFHMKHSQNKKRIVESIELRKFNKKHHEESTHKDA